MEFAPKLALTLLATGLGACDAQVPAAPTSAPARTATDTSGIRNGTRAPEAIALTDGQILSLGWLFEAGRPAANFCTATLIAPDVVVTASHCTDGSDPRDIGFGVGLDPSDPTATFRVASIFEHPQLDLAVLKLAEIATDRVPELEPIPANTVNPEALEGTEVQVGGYGETYDRNRSGRYFATVLLSRVRREEIEVDGRGLQGLCFGDSGGPVIGVVGDEGPVVMGVESWGDQTCYDVDHLTRTDIAADFIAPVLAGGAPPDACNGIDYLGHCVGQISEWCENGQLQRVDCVGEGGHCDYVDNETGWYCVEGAPPDTGPRPDPDAASGSSGGADAGAGGGEPPPAGGEPGPTGGSGGEPPPADDEAGDEPAPGGQAAAGGAEADGADAALAESDGGANADGERRSASAGCSVAPASRVTPILPLTLLAWGAVLRFRRRRSAPG